MKPVLHHVRRRLLQQLAALGVLGPSTYGSVAQASPDLYRIPGEFERAGAIWIGFDEGHTEFTADLVEALLPYVKLKMIVPSAEKEKEARELLRKRSIRADSLEYFVEPLAMFFVRDSAVFLSGGNGHLGMVDFRWNEYGLPGWCARLHGKQTAKARECAEDAFSERGTLDLIMAKLTRAEVFKTRLFLEGGGVEVNGRGLIIANKALLLQRNPSLSLAAIEKEILDLPGIRKVVWLPAGLAQDNLLRSTIVSKYVGWGTGGHTDEFVRFADANTVLLAWPDDSESKQHPVARLNQTRMQACYDILSRATDADGRGLRVIKLPMPKIIERRIVLKADADTGWSEQWTAADFPAREARREGHAVQQVAAASYLNFVIANGVVIVPDYLPHGTSVATQNKVQRILETVFTGRKLHFIDAIGLNWYGGGPHCATLTEPAGV